MGERYKSSEEMPVWKEAMDLSVKIFQTTQKLPTKEDYGLTSQIRRSALSISGNLAEGFGRKHTKGKLNFCYDARGSLTETKNHLIYGQRVGYFIGDDVKFLMSLTEEIWKELNSIIASLKSFSRP